MAGWPPEVLSPCPAGGMLVDAVWLVLLPPGALPGEPVLPLLAGGLAEAVRGWPLMPG